MANSQNSEPEPDIELEAAADTPRDVGPEAAAEAEPDVELEAAEVEPDPDRPHTDRYGAQPGGDSP